MELTQQKLKITREDGANFQAFDPPLPQVHASFSLRLLETHKRFSSDYLYHYVSSTWEDLESCKPLSGRENEEGLIWFEFTKQNNSWRKLSECRLMNFKISGSNGIPYYVDKDKTMFRDDRSETLSNFYSYDSAIKKSEYIFNGYTYFDYHNKDYFIKIGAN